MENFLEIGNKRRFVSIKRIHKLEIHDQEVPVRQPQVKRDIRTGNQVLEDVPKVKTGKFELLAFIDSEPRPSIVKVFDSEQEARSFLESFINLH